MSTGFLRRAWPLIARGLGLGCLAALVGSLLFSVLPVGFGYWVLGGGFAPPWQLDYWLYFGLFVLALGFQAFLCAAAPGAVGGALIGMALYALAPGTHRLPAVGTLIGFLVGGVAVIPTLFLEQASSGRGSPWPWELFWMFYLAAAGVAAASGGCTGRVLARYEVRRRARLSAE